MAENSAIWQQWEPLQIMYIIKEDDWMTFAALHALVGAQGRVQGGGESKGSVYTHGFRLRNHQRGCGEKV